MDGAIWLLLIPLAVLLMAAPVLNKWLFDRCGWCKTRTMQRLQLHSPDTGKTADLCRACMARHINLAIAQGETLGGLVKAGVISHDLGLELAQAAQDKQSSAA